MWSVNQNLSYEGIKLGFALQVGVTRFSNTHQRVRRKGIAATPKGMEKKIGYSLHQRNKEKKELIILL
jgi:hypothetical protein